jgi:hypothetical protein
MRISYSLLAVLLLACSASITLPVRLDAQQPGSALALPSSAALPEAPQPQVEVAVADDLTSQAQSDSSQSNAQAAPGSAPAVSSSSNSAASTQSGDEKSQHETAEEQLKAQEKQRVMGVMATFNTTTNRDALPLSPGQKFQLFFKSATDPWPFVLAGFVSGIDQADDSNPEWGQGLQGYAKRYGANFSDSFIGNFFGNAVLPSILHEDPRYFQKGSGRFVTRALWAASSTVWCKRDRGGWGPNYANVVGNLIGTSIARVYYPASERTVGETIEDGFTVTAEGIVGAEIIEFWPDIARHYKRKHDEKLAAEGAKNAAPAAISPTTATDLNQSAK